ncbi:MAG TPA: hypothetical protein VH115_03650 [Solirubrobacteraceae bacterium]|nr:hypothetical protein [Solirubrobacteraceae bacterium]
MSAENLAGGRICDGEAVRLDVNRDRARALADLRLARSDLGRRRG